ncbi:MAG: HAMP domain-containing sensor histidine kinase [Phototrophicales bacterium]
MTIRKRLTLSYAALLTTIIIFFGVVTYGVMRFTMISNIDSGLAETASLIVTNSRILPATQIGASTPFEIELPSLNLLRAPGVYVQAWAINDGYFEFKGASITAAALLDNPLDPNALGIDHDYFSNATVAGVEMRVLTKPIIQSGSGRFVGNIQVAVDLHTVNQASETLLIVMIVLSTVAIVGSWILGMWFSHRALKPIGEITRTAASVAQTNDLKTRLDWHGPYDELGQLVAVFNQMMARLEHLFSVQQRFVADISHELRTPLTAINGNLELMRMYGADDETLEALESEAKRMARLVNDLLMLARADYGGVTVDRYPLDLDTVVMEAFQQIRVLAKDRDLTISLGQFTPVRIYGNADRMKQVILNLASNAIKFTPDGGEVIIGLENINDHAVLWVRDTGIGICEEDLTRVFDRFFQSETSRTANGSGGFGLGLSIAKWIVEAHEGVINVTSKPNQGTTFTVTIPVYDDTHTQDHHLNQDTHKRATRPRIAIIRR